MSAQEDMIEVTIHVFRYKPGQEGVPYYETYPIAAGPRTTVLDALEYIRLNHDPTLAFCHSCHHASCGVCAMRINGVERLACVTSLQALWAQEGQVVVEPLAVLPLVSDLVVDMNPFFAKFRLVEPHPVQASGLLTARGWLQPQALPAWEGVYTRFEDCIECGACVSACPIAASDPHYLGPAALAAAQRAITEPRDDRGGARLVLVDDEHGCWRCHMAFECSEVCPSNVDPAGKIMDLRRRVVLRRLCRHLGLSVAHKMV